MWKILLALCLSNFAFAAVDRSADGSCPYGLKALDTQCVEVPERDALLCHATLYLRLWSDHHHTRQDARDTCTLAAKSWTVNDYNTDCNIKYDNHSKKYTSLWWYPYKDYSALTVQGIGRQVSNDIAPLMSKRYFYETEVRYFNCGQRETY